MRSKVQDPHLIDLDRVWFFLFESGRSTYHNTRSQRFATLGQNTAMGVMQLNLPLLDRKFAFVAQYCALTSPNRKAALVPLYLS
jgi:hypothetical protein